MPLDFQASIATDYLVFDGVQTITLTKTDGSGTDSVAGVSSFVLSKKQAALLAGMGIEDEVRGFSLPAANVAAGYEPVNGMEFADADGQGWRIVPVEMKTMGNRFQVAAVKTRAAFLHVFEPSLTVPGAQSVVVDGTLDLSELVSIEYDGDAETELSFNVSAASLDALLEIGDMGSFPFVGTLAEIQAAIALTFSYLAGSSAESDTITLTIARNGEAVADTKTIAVTVTEAP